MININLENFVNERDISYIIDAHTNHPKKPTKAFRKFDGITPYFFHPIWCASTIITETSLDRGLRTDGARALLYHDLLEDTTLELPDWLDNKTKKAVQEMTFPQGSSQEMIEIWTREKEIKLYKLYDKISNLLDGSWMDKEKQEKYKDYTLKLCNDVEKNYGSLNITKIARGLSL